MIINQKNNKESLSLVQNDQDNERKYSKKITKLKENTFTRLLYTEGLRSSIIRYLSPANQYALAFCCEEIYQRVFAARFENTSIETRNWLTSFPFVTKSINNIFLENFRVHKECSYSYEKEENTFPKTESSPKTFEELISLRKKFLSTLGNECEKITPVIEYIINCSFDKTADFHFCLDEWGDKFSIDDYLTILPFIDGTEFEDIIDNIFKNK